MSDSQNDKVNLAEKLQQFTEHWSPRIVGELNGQHVKLAKLGAAITLGLVLLAIPAALVAVELFGWGRGIGYAEDDMMGDELFAVGGVGASPPPSCGESMGEPSCSQPL